MIKALTKFGKFNGKIYVVFGLVIFENMKMEIKSHRLDFRECQQLHFTN